MAKNVWLPGDEVGGPQKAYLTPDGRATHPVRVGRAILFQVSPVPGEPASDDTDRLYNRDELVLAEVAPEKRLPVPGRKKVR